MNTTSSHLAWHLMIFTNMLSDFLCIKGVCSLSQTCKRNGIIRNYLHQVIVRHSHLAFCQSFKHNNDYTNILHIEIHNTGYWWWNTQQLQRNLVVALKSCHRLETIVIKKVYLNRVADDFWSAIPASIKAIYLFGSRLDRTQIPITLQHLNRLRHFCLEDVPNVSHRRLDNVLPPSTTFLTMGYNWRDQNVRSLYVSTLNLIYMDLRGCNICDDASVELPHCIRIVRLGQCSGKILRKLRYAYGIEIVNLRLPCLLSTTSMTRLLSIRNSIVHVHSTSTTYTCQQSCCVVCNSLLTYSFNNFPTVNVVQSCHPKTNL